METVTVTVVTADRVAPQGETESTTRERKISRVRKISDALTNIVTLNHHHPGHGFGTLTSQHSVSLADLLRSEQPPDTLSLHSGRSVDYSSGGIHSLHVGSVDTKDHPPKDGNLTGKGDQGHVLGSAGPIVGEDGKKWPQLVASIAGKMRAN